jgi:hypothetical protein
MARFAAGAVFGLVVGIVGAAALGLHAESDELLALATEAGVDPEDLLGAVSTTGLPPREYLLATGELEPPRPNNARPTALERRVDCVIWLESHGNPRAVNPRSGASGLGQFLPSTWRTTPQGRAGLSIFDPIANREAVRWMLLAGRAREFVAVSGGWC